MNPGWHCSPGCATPSRAPGMSKHSPVLQVGQWAQGREPGPAFSIINFSLLTCPLGSVCHQSGAASHMQIVKSFSHFSLETQKNITPIMSCAPFLVKLHCAVLSFPMLCNVSVPGEHQSSPEALLWRGNGRLFNCSASNTNTRRNLLLFTQNCN